MTAKNLARSSQKAVQLQTLQKLLMEVFKSLHQRSTEFIFLEDGTNINKYFINIDEQHVGFQIVYDTIKLEIPFLSQQLSSAGVNFAQNLSYENSIFSRNASSPNKRSWRCHCFRFLNLAET